MKLDLKSALDRLYSDFNYPDSATDPIQIVRRYDAARRSRGGRVRIGALAFGRVASVLQSIERVLAVMGARLPHTVRFDRAATAPRSPGIVHRWTRENDIVALLWVLHQMVAAAGSIEQFFVLGDDPASIDIQGALDGFSTRALALDLEAAYGRVPKRPGVCYFFPRPSAGPPASA